MKVAEERSEDEDIFSSSMQTSLTVELADNNKCTTESHHSKIDSDHEIDEFIKSSQSPTRETLPGSLTNNKINDHICFKDVKISIFHDGLKGGSGNLNKQSTEAPTDPLSRAAAATQDFDETEDNTFSQEGYQLSLELPSTQTFDMQIRRARESNKNYEQEIYPLSLALPSTQDFDRQVKAALDCNTCSQDTPDLFHPKQIDETFDLSLRSCDDSNSDLIEKISKNDKKTVLSNDSNTDFVVKGNHSIILNLEQAQTLSKSASTTPSCSISSCDTEPYEMDDMLFESQNKGLLEITNEKNIKEPKKCNTMNSKGKFCTEHHRSSLSQESELTNSNIDNGFMKNRHINEDSFSGPNSPSLLQEEDYTDTIYNKPILNSEENKKNFDNDSTKLRDYSEPNSPSLLQEGDYSENFESIQKSLDITKKVGEECSKKYLAEESQPHSCIGPNSPSLMGEDYSVQVSCLNCVKSEENHNSNCRHKTCRLQHSESNVLRSNTPTLDFSIVDICTEVAKTNCNANVFSNALVKSNNKDCASSVVNEDFDVLTQISIIDESAAMPIDDVPTELIKPECSSNARMNTKVKSKEHVHYGSSTDEEDLDVLTQISTIDQSAAMRIGDVDFESCTEAMPIVERNLKHIAKDIEIDNSADETQVDYDIATQGVIEAKHNNSDNETQVDFDIATQGAIEAKHNNYDNDTYVDFVAVSPAMQANRCKVDDVDFKTTTLVEPILKPNDVNPAWEKEVDFDLTTQGAIKAKHNNSDIDTDVDFVAATQVSPTTQANIRNLEDIDFEALTPVEPILKPNDDNPDKEIEVNYELATQVIPIEQEKDDITEIKSDFDDIDFEEATQVIPVTPKKFKCPASKLLPALAIKAKSEVKKIDFKVTTVMPITGGKDDNYEIDFEAATQLSPAIQRNDRNLDDLIKTPTQVVPSLNVNDVNVAEEIEVDFEEATQPMPITEAKVDNTEVKRDFDNIDFEAAPQIIPITTIKFKFPASKPYFNKMEDVPALDVTPQNNKVLPAIKVTSDIQLIDNVGFKVPTKNIVKTNVNNANSVHFDSLNHISVNDRSAVNIKESDINCSFVVDGVDFEAETQERVRNPEDAGDFDDVDFEVATQVIPAPPVKLKGSPSKTDFVAPTKLTTIITSNIHNFEEVKLTLKRVPKLKEKCKNRKYKTDLDDVDFEGATQVLTNTDDNETDFDDIDFLAPTQVTSIIQSNVKCNFNDVDYKAPSQMVSIVKDKVKVTEVELKSDSGGIDFEAGTQMLPNIGAKVKNNEEENVLDGVDFEACTQAMPVKEADFDIEVSTQVLPKMDENVKRPDHETDIEDIDFLAPTQVTTVIGANVINSVNKTKGCSEVKATVNKSDNKNSFDDIDFEGCTQVIHITQAKKLNFDDANFDISTQTMPSLKEKSTNFDDVDFEACTQVESTVKGSQDLHLNENRLAAKIIPAYSETLNKYDHVAKDPKSTIKNSINDDDSTDCEEEERGESSSLEKLKSSKSLNDHRHLPTPPEDVQSCDNAMNVNSVENDEEAYMLPTQIDSQSMCFSENQNNSIKQTSKHGDNNNLTEPSNSDSSNELPSTPEFDRQLAEAEAAFNEKNKNITTPKRRHPNSSELESTTRRTKRRRKMTWKMNELMNLNSNSSESFCNTNNDNSNSTPASCISVQPVFRISPSPVPLPNVSATKTEYKYNTRLSLRKRKSLENTPKLRHKPCLRRKRARIIDSESGDENENPEHNTYCVAFAVNPSLSYRSTIQYLGGNIVEVNEANVFICDKFRRTIKVMSALSNGIPMVTSKWILECKRCQRWLDTSNYILKDEGAEKKWKFTLQKSLKKAATSKLLSGYIVFTTPNVTPRASEICKLVESCGGCNIKEIPRVWPTKSFVISCRSDVRLWHAAPTHVKIVEVQFVINSIIHQKLDFSQLILR